VTVENKLSALNRQRVVNSHSVEKLLQKVSDKVRGSATPSDIPELSWAQEVFEPPLQLQPLGGSGVRAPDALLSSAAEKLGQAYADIVARDPSLIPTMLCYTCKCGKGGGWISPCKEMQPWRVCTAWYATLCANQSCPHMISRGGQRYPPPCTSTAEGMRAQGYLALLKSRGLFEKIVGSMNAMEMRVLGWKYADSRDRSPRGQG
jgi:hypothetical protein